MKNLMKDERGEFSVKGLAITIGAIICIAAVVTWLSEGQLIIWVEQVWDAVWQWIQTTFNM